MSETSAAPTTSAGTWWERFGVPALAAFVISAALAAWGTYGGDDAHANRQYLVVLVIIVVAIGIVFGVVLPRSEGGANAARTALILSVLGLLSVAVFWAGLPPVLAIGGIVLARSAGTSGLARTGVVVGVLALLADLAVYLGDQLG
jgi:hypothetical protein